MKISLRKMRAESNIKRIEKALADINAIEAEASLKPIERTDDTFMVATHEDEKKRLLEELAKYQKILAEESK